MNDSLRKSSDSIPDRESPRHPTHPPTPADSPSDHSSPNHSSPNHSSDVNARSMEASPDVATPVDAPAVEISPIDAAAVDEETLREFWEDTSEVSVADFDEQLANELTVEQYHEHLRHEAVHPSQWLLQRGLLKASGQLLAELHLVWLMAQKLRRDRDSLVLPGSDATRSVRLRDGELLGGRLRIVEHLGTGSYGDLYRAWHEGLHGSMAVKVLHPGITVPPDNAEWLEREGRLGRPASEYPLIAFVLQTGHDRGQDFLVMDYVPGTDLAQLLRSRGTLPWKEACGFVRQVVQALVHAGRLDRLPTAVRPSHMMCVEGGTMRLVDWSYDRLQVGREANPLARSLPDLNSAADYLAPELHEGTRKPDLPSVLYSLGCTLFQLLSGSPPFAAHKSIEAKCKAHVQVVPARITSLGHAVPEGVQAVLDRLMAKKPGGRFRSAEALLYRFDRLLDLAQKGSPTVAPAREQNRSPGESVRPDCQFVVTAGPKRGKVFLPAEEMSGVVVGRGKGAGWRVGGDEALSREHFRLEWTPTGYQLLDLESSNGTYVNGQRVAKAELSDGDVITAGNTILVCETYPPGY